MTHLHFFVLVSPLLLHEQATLRPQVTAPIKTKRIRLSVLRKLKSHSSHLVAPDAPWLSRRLVESSSLPPYIDSSYALSVSYYYYYYHNIDSISSRAQVASSPAGVLEEIIDIGACFSYPVFRALACLRVTAKDGALRNYRDKDPLSSIHSKRGERNCCGSRLSSRPQARGRGAFADRAKPPRPLLSNRSGRGRQKMKSSRSISVESVSETLCYKMFRGKC